MNEAITETTHAMQTAIAPVFLIMGASTLLGSMAVRYGRVLDRARAVLRDYESATSGTPRVKRLDDELAILLHRAQLLRTTIILAATSVFFVVLTIVITFAMVVSNHSAPYLPLGSFGLSLVTFMISLALFIKDFAISLRALKTEISARGRA